MTSCRNRAAAALLAAALAGNAAWAQGPIQLVPGLSDGERRQQAPADGASRPAPPPGEALQVVPLGAIDPGSLGLLRGDGGGLPRGLWRGVDRAAAARLISQIKPTVSPAALALARRLLLSEADLPAGGPDGADLFGLRLDRLTALGDAAAAYQLAELAPNDLRTRSQAVSAALLAGRPEAACSLLSGLPPDRRDADWARANAFCALLSGDQAGASIQLGLLKEQGEASPGYLSLMNELAGLGDGKPIDLKEPSPLQAALMKAAKKPPALPALDSFGPAAARLAAGIEGAPPDIVLHAAERAYRFGALPVEAMRAAYEGAQLDAKAVEAALTAKEATGPAGRAALRQAVLKAGGETARAAALRAALERLDIAQPGGLWLRLVNLDVLLALRPDREFLAIAPLAARLLLAAGQVRAAEAWLDLLQWEGRTGRIEPAREAVKLAPLHAIATGGRLAAGEVVDWIDAWRAGGKPEDFDRRAVGLLAILQGLGHEVPGEAWSHLAAGGASAYGRRPGVAVMQSLRGAAQAGRIGETVALALIALDGESPAALEADALATLLDALLRVDLEREARAIALEAALGRDL